MANLIKLRRSAVANQIPTTSQLTLGELALNTYDGKLYAKREQSGTASIVELSGGSGGGGGAVAETLVTISADHSIAASTAGASFSDVEIANGSTVTVPQTSDWQVGFGSRGVGVIAEMLKAINKDFSISHHSNGLSFDDVSIGGSATVTIPSTSTWRIL